MTTIFRFATLADLGNLTSLAKTTFFNTYIELLPEHAGVLQAYVDSSFTIEKITAEYLDGLNEFHVGVSGTEIFAYAKISHWPGKPNSEKVAELQRFYLHNGFQGQGLGGRFFAYLENQMRTRFVEEVRLEVFDGNQRAIEFYKRRGFIEIGVSKFTQTFDNQIYCDTNLILRKRLVC